MRTASFLVIALLPFTVAVAAARHRTDHSAGLREVARLRAHFDSVDRELASRDVSALTRAQRAKRSHLAAVLRTYRDRGRFPRNTDFPGALVPYFVDHGGTACAVGYLMIADGRRDLVSRIARRDNHVRVASLATDTAVVAWLAQAGLTLHEAARIQPTYQGGEPAPRDDGIGRGVLVASAVTTAASGVMIVVNLATPREARGRGVRVAAGIATGIASFIAADATRKDAGASGITAVNAVAGGASIGAALWAWSRPHAARPPLDLGLAMTSARRPAMNVRLSF